MAIRFLGTNSYIRVSLSIPNVIPMSVAYWYRPVSWSATDYIFSVSDTGVTNKYITSRASSTNTSFGMASSGALSEALAGSSAPRNGWTHIGGTVVSTTERTLFWNGRRTATATSSRADFAADTVCIGALLTTSPSNASDMYLAHFCLWRGELTDLEFTLLAQGVSPHRIRPKDAIGYWPLETLSDLSNHAIGGRPLVFSQFNRVIDSSDNPPVEDYDPRLGDVFPFPPATGGGLDKHWNVRFQNRAKQNPIYLR